MIVGVHLDFCLSTSQNLPNFKKKLVFKILDFTHFGTFAQTVANKGTTACLTKKLFRKLSLLLPVENQLLWYRKAQKHYSE
jgi:hypothetical protein